MSADQKTNPRLPRERVALLAYLDRMVRRDANKALRAASDPGSDRLAMFYTARVDAWQCLIEAVRKGLHLRRRTS